MCRPAESARNPTNPARGGFGTAPAYLGCQWPNGMEKLLNRDLTPERSDRAVFTLMIVEDDQAVRESLTEVLQLRGFRVLQARDGEEALRLLSGVTPDILVVDWRLPGITGEKLTLAVRTRTPEVRVIGMSAESWREDEMRQAGASAFLAKPLDIGLLVAMLASA